MSLSMWPSQVYLQVAGAPLVDTVEETGPGMGIIWCIMPDANTIVDELAE
jgi:hypothetical protein